jgi:hypothetical protein
VSFVHSKRTECRDAQASPVARRALARSGQPWRRGKRRKQRWASGTTKPAVLNKLKEIQDRSRRAPRPRGTFTLRDAADEWIKDGLPGRSDKTWRYRQR